MRMSARKFCHQEHAYIASNKHQHEGGPKNNRNYSYFVKMVY
jgi:hypothetical protein